MAINIESEGTMVDPNFPQIPDGTPPNRVKWLLLPNVHAYCQKVLPTIYDDSLSYYEVLNKLMYLLNGVIDNNNNLPEYVKDLLREYVYGDEFKQYVQELIHNITNVINVKFPIELNGIDIPAAVGDGVTDDTEAIQGFLNYVKEKGGSLYFPVGTYLVSSLTMPEKVHLYGVDRYSSLILQKPDTKGTFITGSGSSAVIRDLGIKGNYYVEEQEVKFNDVLDLSYNSLLFMDCQVSTGKTLVKLTVGEDAQLDNLLLFDGQQFIISEGGTVNYNNIISDALSKASNPFQFNHEYSLFDIQTRQVVALPIAILNGSHNRLTITTAEKESLSRASVNYVENLGSDNEISIVGIQEVRQLSGSSDVTIGSNQSVHVGGDRMDEVQGNSTALVNGDALSTVKGNFIDNIDGDLTTNVQGNDTKQVEGKAVTDIGQERQVTVAGMNRENYNGGTTQTVNGNKIETVTGSRNVMATQDNTNRGMSIENIAGEPANLPAAQNGTNLVAGQQVHLFGNPLNGIQTNQSPKSFNRIWNYINYQDTTVDPIQTHRIPVIKDGLDPDLLDTVWITPEMFGAKGDGVTDDSDAIQAWANLITYPHLLLNRAYVVTKPINFVGGYFLGTTLLNGFRITATNVTFNVNIATIFENIRFEVRSATPLFQVNVRSLFDGCYFQARTNNTLVFCHTNAVFNECIFDCNLIDDSPTLPYTLVITKGSSEVNNTLFFNSGINIQGTSVTEKLNTVYINNCNGAVRGEYCTDILISNHRLSHKYTGDTEGIYFKDSNNLNISHCIATGKGLKLNLLNVDNCSITNSYFSGISSGNEVLRFDGCNRLSLLEIRTPSEVITVRHMGQMIVTNNFFMNSTMNLETLGSFTNPIYVIIKNNYLRTITNTTGLADDHIIREANYPVQGIQ